MIQLLALCQIDRPLLWNLFQCTVLFVLEVDF